MNKSAEQQGEFLASRLLSKKELDRLMASIPKYIKGGIGINIRKIGNQIVISKAKV